MCLHRSRTIGILLPYADESGKPRTTDLRPWLWGAALAGSSEHLPREIGARAVFKVSTEEIISRGESPRSRTGRITAAKKYGARAVGFEIDHNLVRMSRASVKREGVGHLVEIREQDVMTADFSPASVVTIYLLPGSHMLLRPVLWRQLKPGAEWVPTMTIWKTGHRKMS
jgi:hypothetical protein